MVYSPSMKSWIYREDGGKYVVKVLADTTTADGMRAVKLECVRTLRPSPLNGAIPPGEVFEVSCRNGYEAYIGWYLSEEAP